MLDLLHFAQGAVHLPRAYLRTVDLFGGFFEAVFGFGQYVAKFTKLGFDRAEHLPDFGGAFLHRQRAESHVQAIEQCGQRRRPGDHDAVFALQLVEQSGFARDLGVQPFGRQEHHGEIGGVRWRDVFFVDGFGFQLNLAEQIRARFVQRDCVGQVLRLLHALVLLFREFGVNRQPHHVVQTVAAPRQFDGEFNHFVAVRYGFDVRGVAIRRKDVLQQIRQLHLAPSAARFDVGQHTFEVTHADGEVLHFAQAAMHLLQSIGHLFERFAQALLQCGV